MPVDPTVAWIAVGISTFVYVVAALTASAFASGPLPWARSPGVLSDGEEDVIPPELTRLNFGNITSAARAIAIASVVAVSLSVAYAVAAVTDLFGTALLVSGSGMAVTLLAISVAVAWIDVSSRARMRSLVLPIGRSIGWTCRLPVLNSLVDSPTGNEANGIKTEDDVLDDGLSLLEAAGVSPDPEELEMIRAVMRLDRARVREIMEPRVDMISAEADRTFEELAGVMTEAGHSRIPIYEESIDHVTGVVHAQDMLRAWSGRSNVPLPSIRELARPALFVPESQMLDQLLREFQAARTQIAIVVDEYGGVSGLVTVQDLIEEIVGELMDEFDTDEAEMQRISDVELLMDARMPLDTLQQELGADIPAEGFDTVGGLVYRELGKMPRVGDQVAVDGIRITVVSTAGRRINKIRVRKVLNPPE